MRPSFLIGLKIGTPLIAIAMAPRKNAVFADFGCAAGFGCSGTRQLLSPVYGCGSGTCCCQAVISVIISWSGMPSDAT